METKPTIPVRTFEARDVGPACDLTNFFITNTMIHFGTVPASNAEFEAMWRAGAGRYPWLAAEVAGVFAGYARAYEWRSRDAYRFTAETGLYVAADARGMGVGRALYTELFARLRAGGFHRAVAGISLPNDASVALHEAVGFVRVGTFKEVGRKFDAWHDVGFWERGVAE